MLAKLLLALLLCLPLAAADLSGKWIGILDIATSGLKLTTGHWTTS